jgi:tripartite-type tricarboxylate transporter receptor subunit TctC
MAGDAGDRAESTLYKETVMTFTRRQTLGLAAAALLTGPVSAQTGDWPSRPITLIIPFLPGTSPDITMRPLVEAMGATLKQPIVVENRAGAAGSLGAQLAARAAPDGYTWMYAANVHAATMRMRKNPGFDILKDFTMVGRTSTAEMLLVAPVNSGLKTLKDLVDLARKNPGKLNFASGGPGSPAHLAAELMLSTAGVTATHIPFKGASESLTAVIGNQVDFAMIFTSVALPQVKAGKVAVLGITSGTRNPVVSDVLTLVEQGLAGVEVTGFGGLAVPAGTPPAIVNRIWEVMREALARPDIRAKMEAKGNPPRPAGPEEFAAAMRAEIVLTERMMKVARIEAQ